MITEYVPSSKAECVSRLEDALNELDDAIAEHGESSYDARDCYVVLKWILDGAVKAGYVGNNLTVDLVRNDGHTTKVTWHNQLGSYEYADEAYWTMKNSLEEE